MNKLERIRHEFLSPKIAGIILSSVVGVGRVLSDEKVQRLTGDIESSRRRPNWPRFPGLRYPPDAIIRAESREAEARTRRIIDSRQSRGGRAG